MFLYRNTRMFGLVLVLFMTVLFAGCGGGGGGGGDAGGESVPTISGVAAKGPILNGTVNVYALAADGTKGEVLGSAQTSAVNGAYSVSLGSYAGNVIVEVTGGTYKDEATGTMVANTSTLRAALANVSGEVSLAVTPLTDLAVQLAGTLTAASINESNSLVTSMVGFNIVGTLPVDVTDSASSGSATQDQKSYGLMLAAISQTSKEQGISHDQVVTNLKNDIIDDGKLDDTGSDLADCLQNFIKTAFNQSGVTSTAGTPLFAAINHSTYNPITSTADTADLDKAKKIITDLRNIAFSVYDRENGMIGVVESPYNNFTKELEEQLKPLLTISFKHIGLVMENTQDVAADPTGWGCLIDDNDDSLPDFVLGINRADDVAGTRTYNFGLVTYSDYMNAPGAPGRERFANITNKLAQGVLVIDDILHPTSGTLNATFANTASGVDDRRLTITASYNATVDGNGRYTSMTLTGNAMVPGLIELDFSKEGRSLSAEFFAVPGSETLVYPTDISFSGIVKTNTAQFTGAVDISDIRYFATAYDYYDGPEPVEPGVVYPVHPVMPVWPGDYASYEEYSAAMEQYDLAMEQYWNDLYEYWAVWNEYWDNMDEYESNVEPVAGIVFYHHIAPVTATVTGTVEELSNGVATGTKFTGTISGNWTNPDTFNIENYNNADEEETPTNYLAWNATFTGKFESPSGPTVTASLRAARVDFDDYAFDVNFSHTNAYNVVVLITGNAMYNHTSELTTVELTNQDNMKICITYDGTKSGDEKLAGTIKTSGGAKQADIYTVEKMPVVKFIDDYFESLP